MLLNCYLFADCAVCIQLLRSMVILVLYYNLINFSSKTIIVQILYLYFCLTSSISYGVNQ
jgi:hypothetical protein